jgi:hypothetical protein
MITIDCPICEDTATVDESLDAVTCDACGLVASIAPEPVALALDLAA